MNNIYGMRTMKDIPVLKIGDLEICPPIIQGGMGVKVSRAGLAAAVANEGCAGVIASVGLGMDVKIPGMTIGDTAVEFLRREIRKAKEMSKGPIGVNIMYALTHYGILVKAAVEENADFIVSGAGLPLDLPKYLSPGSRTKLIPVVSSARALQVICKRWARFNKQPDAVIVEGPLAGGHLGYSHDSVNGENSEKLEDIIKGVIEFANTCEPRIPVIAAGGIFDGADIAHFLKLGASGVQMATRFVCTTECDAHDNFKQAYINAKEEDITIIKSPVGLPGRVIRNDFVNRLQHGERLPFKCEYKCLWTCDPEKSPYCIARVLGDAADGYMQDAFAFAGANAYRCNEIISVKELVTKLVAEMHAAQD